MTADSPGNQSSDEDGDQGANEDGEQDEGEGDEEDDEGGGNQSASAPSGKNTPPDKGGKGGGKNDKPFNLQTFSGIIALLEFAKASKDPMVKKMYQQLNKVVLKATLKFVSWNIGVIVIDYWTDTLLALLKIVGALPQFVFAVNIALKLPKVRLALSKIEKVLLPALKKTQGAKKAMKKAQKKAPSGKGAFAGLKKFGKKK